MSESLPLHDVPHVTVIRPLKGLEPYLYECLAATFRLTYPIEKLTVYFCISDRTDPAIPIVSRLLQDFPQFDAKLFIEEEDDDHLRFGSDSLGPNPKIRNISRAYREAKGDLIWILDCNVWVAKGVAGRLVDTLEGLSHQGPGLKYKFVHQLPLVVDVTSGREGLLDSAAYESSPQAASTSTAATSVLRSADVTSFSPLQLATSVYGSRVEEVFLSSSHAKMYTAINTVLIAPCIVGKSNMFRRSHLDALTRDSPDFRPPGVDYFSYNICEDHLIGDLLWKSDVPEEVESRQTLGKHAMVFGDLAIQPMAAMSVGEYAARRIRWLRVRKFTVTAATLVEPGTESILCSIYGAYGMTACPWVYSTFGVPQTWSTFVLLWSCSMAMWMTVDRAMYRILHSMKSIEQDANTPLFAKSQIGSRRSFRTWALAWLCREVLALPIWLWAVWAGATVQWRGKRFRVGIDMKVHALDSLRLSGLHERLDGSHRAMSRTPDVAKARRE